MDGLSVDLYQPRLSSNDPGLLPPGPEQKPSAWIQLDECGAD
jgi:hypothetical protein